MSPFLLPMDRAGMIARIWRDVGSAQTLGHIGGHGGLHCQAASGGARDPIFKSLGLFHLEREASDDGAMACGAGCHACGTLVRRLPRTGKRGEFAKSFVTLRIPPQNIRLFKGDLSASQKAKPDANPFHGLGILDPAYQQDRAFFSADRRDRQITACAR
jgi:hypothetical protein